MVCFFEDTKDIKLAVMESLPRIASERLLTGWISGADAPDTTQLTTEITKLNEENRKLRKERDAFETKLKRASIHNDEDEFKDIDKEFSKKKLILNAEAFNKEKDTETDLLTIVNHLKEKLVAGFTTKFSQYDSVNFIVDNVIPILVTYGLATYEKMAGTQSRRVVMTPKGLGYIKHLTKNHDLEKKS